MSEEIKQQETKTPNVADITFDKPNGFVFKANIDGKYRICICPRIDDKWSEEDIFYIQDAYPTFDESLEEKLFHIVYVYFAKNSDTNQFTIKHSNTHFLKSDKYTSEDLYANGLFFSTIEEGYQMFYGSKSTDKQQ